MSKDTNGEKFFDFREAATLKMWKVKLNVVDSWGVQIVEFDLCLLVKKLLPLRWFNWIISRLFLSNENYLQTPNSTILKRKTAWGLLIESINWQAVWEKNSIAISCSVSVHAFGDESKLIQNSCSLIQFANLLLFVSCFFLFMDVIQPIWHFSNEV